MEERNKRSPKRRILRGARRATALAALALTLFAALGLALSAGALYANAAENAVILKVGNITAEPGDTVEIAVSVENNPGISGMKLSLSYDESALSLVSAENGAAFSSFTFTTPGELVSNCRFLWEKMEKLSAEEIKDGAILTLRFDVKDGAAAGSYPISLSYEEGEIFDSELEPLEPAVQNGKIEIAGSPEPLPEINSASAKFEEGAFVLRIDSEESYEDACVYLASYSDTGRFEGFEKRKVDLQSGENVLRFENKSAEAEYRAFLLDKFDRPCCSFADDGEEEPEGFAIVAGTANAKAGDRGVSVEISVAENPGISGMTLSFSYDESALSLVSAENGAAFSSFTFTTPGELVSHCAFLWEKMEKLSAGDIKDGVMLTLRFDVKAGAVAGSYPISLSYEEGEIFDAELEPLEPAVRNGKIIVS